MGYKKVLKERNAPECDLNIAKLINELPKKGKCNSYFFEAETVIRPFEGGESHQMRDYQPISLLKSI